MYSGGELTFKFAYFLKFTVLKRIQTETRKYMRECSRGYSLVKNSMIPNIFDSIFEREKKKKSPYPDSLSPHAIQKSPPTFPLRSFSFTTNSFCKTMRLSLDKKDHF